MKHALRNFAAVLCLLMLVVSSASCMDIASHSKTSCSDCTKHQPPSQQTPACCDAHQQPSAIAATIIIEQPAQFSAVASSVVVHLRTLVTLSPRIQLIWPPPLSPHIKLRI